MLAIRGASLGKLQLLSPPVVLVDLITLRLFVCSGLVRDAEFIPISPGLLAGRSILVIVGSTVVAVFTRWTDADSVFVKRALAYLVIDTIRVVAIDCLAKIFVSITYITLAPGVK